MKKFLLMSLFVAAAIVLGALIGDNCAAVDGLNWLSYSKAFSFQPGTLIDIDVFCLTFGIAFQMNVAQLLLLFIAIFAYYKLAPKLISSK